MKTNTEKILDSLLSFTHTKFWELLLYSFETFLYDTQTVVCGCHLSEHRILSTSIALYLWK